MHPHFLSPQPFKIVYGISDKMKRSPECNVWEETGANNCSHPNLLFTIVFFKAIKFGFESLNVPFTALFANKWGVKFICILTLNLSRIWCIFNTIQYTLLSSNHIFSLILWSRRYFIEIHLQNVCLEHSFAVKRTRFMRRK